MLKARGQINARGRTTLASESRADAALLGLAAYLGEQYVSGLPSRCRCAKKW